MSNIILGILYCVSDFLLLALITPEMQLTCEPVTAGERPRILFSLKEMIFLFGKSFQDIVNLIDCNGKNFTVIGIVM